MSVVWKDVIGFEEYFRVSENGDIWSKRSNKILKQHTNKDGYKVFATRIGGRKGSVHCFRVHRFVAEAFLEPVSKELYDICSKQGYGNVLVRHLDNDKTNNHYSNLAWGTYKDNSDDYLLTQTYSDALASISGSNHTSARFTDEEVLYIRSIYKPKCKINGLRALAKRYNIAHSALSSLVNNKSYKELLV